MGDVVDKVDKLLTSLSKEKRASFFTKNRTKDLNLFEINKTNLVNNLT